ncbi:MAG TPA: DUF533 domain-containing protein [Candidatus Thalassarchaeaceae archaeon]|nr:DUF533 domain-containing protein [Candidatus Thalassarchaeaceae archaeon]
MLPDAIDFLEEGDREGYVRILIAMAGADGTLVREETAAIEAAMGRALIPPGKRDLLRQELKVNLEIDEIIKEMSDVAIRLALRDATIVGACDGEFQEEEIQFLTELAKRCELSDEDVNRLFQWVDRGWSWLQDSREWLNLSPQTNENDVTETNE